jgi:hypothetical protein
MMRWHEVKLKALIGMLIPNNDWYPASIFFQGMKYMVFGDPALRLPARAK